MSPAARVTASRRTVFVAHSWKLLTDHEPNGDGLFAWGLVRRLAERGHRLHVACRGLALRGPPPAGVVLHQLGRDPVDLRVTERLRYMRHLRRLYGQLRRQERLDVVHQLNPVDAGVSLALPGDAPPLVLGPYWSDWPVPRPHGPLSAARLRGGQAARRALATAQQRRAAAVLIGTEAAREKVRVRGCLVAVVPMGVDSAAFPFRSPAPPGRPPTVVFLANLREAKGVYTLLDAFEEVARRMPDARLLLAGGGPEEAALRARAAASAAGDRIELLGPVDPRAVPDVLSRGDVSCQPGHGEPFGWSAVEAMACGLPVVVTDVAGVAAVVPDDAGIKVPVGDARALADALAALLADPERRAAMGAAGRRAVEGSYDWDRVVDRVEEVYEAVVAPRR